MLETTSNNLINDQEYNECIKCIEFLQTSEYKNEPINISNIISPTNICSQLTDALGKPFRKDIYKQIWMELESYLKCYQDTTERHRILYNHVRNMLISSIRSENLIKNKAGSNAQLSHLIKTEDSIIQT